MTPQQTAAMITEGLRECREGKGMSELKPAKNFRRVSPRVCATCRFGTWETYEDNYGTEQETGTFICGRPNGVELDGQDLEPWYYTCDRWQEPRYENG